MTLFLFGTWQAVQLCCACLRERESRTVATASTQGASSGQEKTVNNLGLHSSLQCMQAQGSTFKMKNIRHIRCFVSELIISAGIDLL